ncbi:MAG: flagellar biosynthetic protein FliQ [Bacillus subtilis]|nr:flagellar biosynthetic protein FliQ [Bacillus subtilis]
MELLMEHLGKGFVNMLLISMPVVLTAASIGLVVGVLQAVTQVQEQTIAAAPKILGVFLAIMILSGFFHQTIERICFRSDKFSFFCNS